MSKDISIAPKERINIVYRAATGNVEESVELPMKTLVIGKFKSGHDNTPLSERSVIDVNKDNFNDVLKEQQLDLSINVANKLTGEQDDEENQLPVNLKFESLSDFSPDGIVKQVPSLAKLIELRNALKTLKSPLGNVPEFKKKLAAIMKDPTAKEQLIKELAYKEEDK
ncbi:MULTISPECIES: type VI secretion system contractile sheath small subunit [unclassified Francisella]|uniref:type VI secretion system contractile sheath small subunit n=1 Tax=unclassified Francisella TaxID=2610885 RepID=UPI002E2FCF15|nr:MULTISPECIES: type VI secretion system contractile sheath small subunit [unclassified Francisella]MED7818330.1 type VI secretion system contractile sheath small subunit [Francisella sp. 19S2-4]MED7829166.1 type VI secretion system contractile sheath small subunit [Francisella sp. 19S2-10]